MLSVGQARSRTCRGIGRRAFLRIGTLGVCGLGFADLLRAQALGAATNGRARSVILLWLWGGPSHLDTFDMKPDAPTEYRGPFEPIATTVPGLQICEHFPELAKLAHKFAVLRSLHHESNDHGIAGTIGLTGNINGAVGLDGKARGETLRPSTGAIVGRLRPTRPGTLPPYVILGDQLHQGLKTVVGEGGGSLGSAYDPFRLTYEPGIGLKLPDVELPDDVTAQRFGARWDLLRTLGNAPKSPEISRLDRHFDLAHTLIASRETLKALSVEHEPASVRDVYGGHRFGQCCLIARRLVEAGQPFVQVNWSTHVEGPEDAGDGGWDMHDRYFQVMQDRHGWMLDRALSALLNDLDAKGMLESTLVVAVGEFGRTPKINEKAGRDHWNNCYSALLAGGGIQGGRIVGSSDKRGEQPVDRPSTPADLNATMLDLLGVGAADLTALNLTPSGSPIVELL